jgi:hypothetical protein
MLTGLVIFIFLCHYKVYFLQFIGGIVFDVLLIGLVVCYTTQIYLNFLCRIFMPLYYCCTKGSEKEKGEYVMVGSPSSLPTFEVKVQLSTIDFKWILDILCYK